MKGFCEEKSCPLAVCVSAAAPVLLTDVERVRMIAHQQGFVRVPRERAAHERFEEDELALIVQQLAHVAGRHERGGVIAPKSPLPYLESAPKEGLGEGQPCPELAAARPGCWRIRASLGDRDQESAPVPRERADRRARRGSTLP